MNYNQADILISVVVPVYNCADTLHLTVESLLKQTFQNLEIILVDDGAKDDSGSLCDQYVQSDNRIIAVHQSNKGLAGARNTGIKVANGEYISFIDAGDYVELNLYESLLEYIHESIDFIAFPFFTQNLYGERFPSINRIEKNKIFDRRFIDREMMPCLLNIEDNPVINDPPICFSVIYLYKRSLINNNNILFDERRRKWEDKGFVVKYVDSCQTVVFYDKPLYNYLCLNTGTNLSASYFRDLVFLIIEQREEYQKKYGSRYSFKTEFYYRNSISIIMGRIEEIVEHETEEDAKELIEMIYAEQFVQSLAVWEFADDNNKMHEYQRLISVCDINGTYLLMNQRIEQKKKDMVRKNKKSIATRVKNKTKSLIRPLYYIIKKKYNWHFAE